MINLLPITKVIAIIAIIYAVLIAAILTFIHDANSTVLSSVIIALKGATALNIVLLLVCYIGWRKIWKMFPSLNNLLFPDLNGEWEMTIYWHWEEKKGTTNATAYIKQDFIKMSMEVMSEDSESNTLLAKPKKDPESGRPMLYYIYRNTPKLKNGNNVIPYDGTALLKLAHNNLNYLKGNYYTDRLTYGRYELKRK